MGVRPGRHPAAPPLPRVLPHLGLGDTGAPVIPAARASVPVPWGNPRGPSRAGPTSGGLGLVTVKAHHKERSLASELFHVSNAS